MQRYVQELAMRRRARDENGDAWYETHTALDPIRSLQAQREPKEGEICEAECLGEPREPTLAKTNLSDPCEREGAKAQEGARASGGATGRSPVISFTGYL